MVDDRRDTFRGDRRNQAIRKTIEELYYGVYLTTYEKAHGVVRISSGSYSEPEGCEEDVLVLASALGAQDSISATSTGKKTMKEFAQILANSKAYIYGSQFTHEELRIANF